jgi:hypothetical protein
MCILIMPLHITTHLNLFLLHTPSFRLLHFALYLLTCIPLFGHCLVFLHSNACFCVDAPKPLVQNVVPTNPCSLLF